MQAISTKELRNNLPFVRSELKKGQKFLLIHQSRPIAQLTPVDDIPYDNEEEETETENISLIDVADNDFLTQKELDYYLSLK